MVFGQGTKFSIFYSGSMQAFPSVSKLEIPTSKLSSENVSHLLSTTEESAIGGVPSIGELKASVIVDEASPLHTLAETVILNQTGGLAPQYPFEVTRTGSSHGYRGTGSFLEFSTEAIEGTKTVRANIVFKVASGYTKY